MKASLFPHLKDAHPVPGVGLEGSSEGVAAGDGGCGWVRVRDVDEHHLGEGARWGVGGCSLCRALHAEFKSAGKLRLMMKQHIMSLTDDGRCHKMACAITDNHIGVFTGFLSLLFSFLRTFTLVFICFQVDYAFVINSNPPPPVLKQLLLHIKTIPFPPRWHLICYKSFYRQLSYISD